jgi:sulfite reductase (ferredoxin)
MQNLDITDDPDQIVSEFKQRFYDTEIFFDRFAGGKFAQYLFRRHEGNELPNKPAAAREMVEEASLFVEACYACSAKLAAKPAPAASTSAVVTLEL